MKSLFNTIVLAFAFSSIANNTSADTENFDINQTCKEHSIQIIKTMKQELLTDMSDEEIKAALSIANQSCHEYFGGTAHVSRMNKEDSPAEVQAKVQTETEPESKKADSAWFTEYVLHGDPHEKKGVKRLKNRKH